MNTSILAIVQRQLRKFFHTKISWVNLISVPSILILAMILGIDKIVKIPFNIAYSAFLVSGFLCIYVANNSAYVGFYLKRDNEGFFKLLKTTPLSRLSIVMGILIGELLILLMGIVIFLILTGVYYKIFSLFKLVIILFYLILLALGFFSFSLIFFKFFDSYNTFSLRLYFFLLFGAYATSGVFYPLTNIPQLLKFIIYINPLSYAVDAIRYFLFGVNQLNLVYGGIFLVLFSGVMIAGSVILLDK